jgi:membrane protein YdbS with pleckstrin-like domain
MAGDQTAGDQTAGDQLPGLRAPVNQVSRRAIPYWTTRAVVAGLVLLAVEIAVILVNSLAAAWWIVVALTAIILAAYALIMPHWRFRVHRWEVTEQALYTRTGWFSVHWRIAPISRIQTIDSHRSLGERIFGLANVTATTASAAGPVHIHGLDRATADRLLDELSLATAQIPGDAT